MPKARIFFVIGAFVLALLPAAALAFETKTGDSVYVPTGETVNGMLFAAGNSVAIDGTVDGDLFCAGKNISINGTVEGDVFCAGETVNVSGNVKGSIRSAASNINISGKTERNAMLFGSSILLDKNSETGRDVFFAGANADFRGKIGKNLSGFSPAAVIAGEVGGNVDVRMENGIKDKNIKSSLTITDSAKIGGNLSYSSFNEALIAPGASIGGETKRNEPKIAAEKKFMNFGRSFGFLVSLFSSLVIGLVIVSVWRERIIALTDKMLEKILSSIGFGLAVMFLAPILSILLIFTLIGIPLAVIIMLFWLIMLMLSKTIVGILAGRALIEKFWEKKKNSLVLTMIIGVIAVEILCALPILGWVISLVIFWWGMGGVWMYFKKER